MGNTAATVSLKRVCRATDCTQEANRVVIRRCGFTNEWRNYGTSLCVSHAYEAGSDHARGVIVRVESRTACLAELHADRPTHTPVAPEMLCGRCYRPLQSERARRAGYGRGCLTLVRKAQREALTAGFSADQVNKANELIDDAAIIRIRPGIYMAVSSDGSRIYRCARQNCTCPALKPCLHVLAVLILESDGKPVARMPFVLPAPRKAPEWKASVCQYGDLSPVTHTVTNSRAIEGLCAVHAAGYGYPQYLTPVSVPTPRKEDTMSLSGLNPSPLNPDSGLAARIDSELKEIMSAGPELANEDALYELVDTVADALHTGKCDIPEHDALLVNIRKALGSLI